MKSLAALGLSIKDHDIRFLEDNWESPTLGAWGLGWEVWVDGMEVSQFTYFQQVAGQECRPITGEITYGLERLAMYLQECDNIYDLIWSKGHGGMPGSEKTYRDLFRQNEEQMSQYNFSGKDTERLRAQFDQALEVVRETAEDQLPLVAMESVMDASHIFNLLDARRALSPIARQDFVRKVREGAVLVAQAYLAIPPS